MVLRETGSYPHAHWEHLWDLSLCQIQHLFIEHLTRSEALWYTLELHSTRSLPAYSQQVRQQLVSQLTDKKSLWIEILPRKMVSNAMLQGLTNALAQKAHPQKNLGHNFYCVIGLKSSQPR